MASVYDVNPNLLIEKTAGVLKKIDVMKAPSWAVFCKTGTHKERPPLSPDWWYFRAASLLRKVYLKGPIGVSKLRTIYGGRKNMGMQPERFKKGSGSIIRKAFQQLEKAELVKQAEKGTHKGRVITPKGKSLLDKTATAVQKEAPKEEVYKPISAVVKKEAPKAEQPKVEEKKAEKAPQKKKEKAVEGKKVGKKPEVKEKPVEKKAETKKE